MLVGYNRAGSYVQPYLLEALSREFREGLPMELLYADDLVLIAETKELLLEKGEEMEGGDGKEGSESKCWKQRSRGARVRLRILESIHVVFAGRELVTTQSHA